MRQIYHYYRIIGVQGLKPIPVSRFNLPLALDEALQGGATLASIITKKEFLIGSKRTAAFLDLPILGFDYLQERFYLVEQIIKGMQREKPEEAIQKVTTVYKKAEELRMKEQKAEAFMALDEAYKLGTAVWNPQRK